MSSNNNSTTTYGIFSDWDKTFKRWFTGNYKGQLKNVHIDHVLSGTTCQPISLQDFRFYLQYKEHTAENLDFYFWFIGYRNRFNALSDEEKAKSPPPKERPSPGFVYGKGKGEKDEEEDDLKKDIKHWDQPFREEIDAIVQTFFHEDSFKELNIEGYMNKYTTFYSTQTTHPDIFLDVHEHIYNILKTSSFTNFIHYGTQNIRYTFAVIQYGGAIFNFVHIPMILYYTFSNHMCRWYRMSLFWFSFFFAASVLSGRAGFCTIRGIMKFRQVPIYEFSEYKVERGVLEKFIKNGEEVVIEQDLEKNQKPKTGMTQIIDPEVLKYGRQMFFHIYIASTVFAFIVTLIGVSITNENEPLPGGPPAMAGQ
ncbi:unnamed protein product [Mucor hiemalis]